METIKNVIFDMGGVLMDWNPVKISQTLCPNPDDAALVAHAVFDSREWGWVDAGAIDPQTVAWTAKLKLPERLHPMADRFVNHWYDEGVFEPLPATGELVRELKDAGYGVYLLSNAGTTFGEYRSRIPAIEVFDGVVVSCYEHVVKPDSAIYLLLCERYGLEPSTCLFVDDVRRNVVGAERVGMRGFLFEGDVEALRSYLQGGRDAAVAPTLKGGQSKSESW